MLRNGKAGRLRREPENLRQRRGPGIWIFSKAAPLPCAHLPRGSTGSGYGYHRAVDSRTAFLADRQPRSQRRPRRPVGYWRTRCPRIAPRGAQRVPERRRSRKRPRGRVGALRGASGAPEAIHGPGSARSGPTEAAIRALCGIRCPRLFDSAGRSARGSIWSVVQRLSNTPPASSQIAPSVASPGRACSVLGRGPAGRNLTSRNNRYFWIKHVSANLSGLLNGALGIALIEHRAAVVEQARKWVSAAFPEMEKSDSK